MKHAPALLSLGFLTLLPFAALKAADAPAEKPNIIVILTDDHGWADLGANGVEENFDPMRGEVVTLPERLKASGYATGISGKWHLDRRRPRSGPPRSRSKTEERSIEPRASMSIPAAAPPIPDENIHSSARDKSATSTMIFAKTGISRSS